MKKYLLFTICLFGSLSLFGQKNTSLTLNQYMAKAIIEKIKADPELPDDGPMGIIMIGEWLCAEQDCKLIFKDLPVTVYQREELFMRAIKNYYAILSAENIAGGKSWEIKFAYLLDGGKSSVPRTITGQNQ